MVVPEREMCNYNFRLRFMPALLRRNLTSTLEELGLRETKPEGELSIVEGEGRVRIGSVEVKKLNGDPRLVPQTLFYDNENVSQNLKFHPFQQNHDQKFTPLPLSTRSSWSLYSVPTRPVDTSYWWVTRVSARTSWWTGCSNCWERAGSTSSCTETAPSTRSPCSLP